MGLFFKVLHAFKHENILILSVSQEEIADQRLQKEAQVTLYRNYRVGDFPDIQISYSSLITPLQALSQVRLVPAVLQIVNNMQGIQKG